MTKRLLRVDYPAIAELLHTKLEEAQDPDTPPHELCFVATRSILAGKVESLLMEMYRPFNGDSSEEKDPLVNILFADLGSHDSVMDMGVSQSPGFVARVHGKNVVLPLILIEVS
ncbi:hypothetical protein D3C81_375860 [compost metagenome]